MALAITMFHVQLQPQGRPAKRYGAGQHEDDPKARKDLSAPMIENKYYQSDLPPCSLPNFLFHSYT
jgi:hypothetical protein